MCKTILYVYVLPSEKAWVFQSLHSPLIKRHSTANGVTLCPQWEYVGIGLE